MRVTASYFFPMKRDRQECPPLSKSYTYTGIGAFHIVDLKLEVASQTSGILRMEQLVYTLLLLSTSSFFFAWHRKKIPSAQLMVSFWRKFKNKFTHGTTEPRP
jgi:hypothetical protein